MIINQIYSQIVDDILNERIGKTGDLFFTAEEVIERYSVSYLTALRLIKKLVDGKYLISIGNKKFIMNGLYSKNCPLYSLIDSPQKKIGIIIQDITNPFFSSITASLYSQMLENGFTPVLKISSRETEADVLVSFIQEGCQGIISFFQNNTSEIMDVYNRLPVPVVFISDDVPTEKHSVVNSDNLRSGYMAAEHLSDYGYDSLYYCGLSKKGMSPRLQGFLNYIEKHNIPFDEKHILYFDIANPYRNHYIIKKILEDKSNRIGIFCFHDLIALYLYNLCIHNNIPVPEKVGLIGYDKLDSMIPANVKLTTFSYSFNNISNSTLKLLISSMESLLPKKTIITELTILFIGKTTAKPEKPQQEKDTVNI